ncbi:DoxX family protein [Pseudonocardia sp. RS010]|uniref:DoxX family protein n=1 Tax=Pseudonocardia sp. RS010 TaxID=3385979 RepID=UPI0039A0940F
MEIGLVLLRAVVGLLMAGHGAQKLFGWFDGHGLDGTAGFLQSLGWHPARRFAVLLGASELLGGLALALGFATPLAAGVVIAVLANAAWVVHRQHGLWNTNGGYEYPLALAGAALALAFTGPGIYSVDTVLGWPLAGPVWGLIALGIGLLGWLGGVTARILRPAGRHFTPNRLRVA